MGTAEARPIEPTKDRMIWGLSARERPANQRIDRPGKQQPQKRRGTGAGAGEEECGTIEENEISPEGCRRWCSRAGGDWADQSGAVPTRQRSPPSPDCPSSIDGHKNLTIAGRLAANPASTPTRHEPDRSQQRRHSAVRPDRVRLRDPSVASPDGTLREVVTGPRGHANETPNTTLICSMSTSHDGHHRHRHSYYQTPVASQAFRHRGGGVGRRQ